MEELRLVTILNAKYRPNKKDLYLTSVSLSRIGEHSYTKLKPNVNTNPRGSHIGMFTTSKQASQSVLQLAQWQCQLTDCFGSHNMMFLLYATCDSSLLTDSGDDYNGVEQGAGERPLHNCLVFRPVPTVGFHRPQQILLEYLQPVFHFACPCIFDQHIRLFKQGPQFFCDVETDLTDITFYLQQWNKITTFTYSDLTG